MVVDDAHQAISDVVRGADLLDSTPRQCYLQRLLGLATPHYAHLPVALDADRRKLSKHSCAAATTALAPGVALCAALRFLGHAAPTELESESPSEVLRWALSNWRIESVPTRRGAIWAGLAAP